MKWHSLSTHQEVEIGPYLKDWIEGNPDHKIYIGCDSHNHNSSKKTIFATVIVLHKRGSGGHVLYNRLGVSIMNSQFERLWKEVELSVQAAKILEEVGIHKPDYIDIDLNPDPKYQSNTLLRAAVGMIESMGIKARYKHLSNWSIPIADKICK